MKSAKNIILVSVLALTPLTLTYGILGFGLHLTQDNVSVAGVIDSRNLDLVTVTVDRQGFDNSFGIGGYLYLDVIPFIDLEVDFQVAGNMYTFNFQNYLNNSLVSETGDTDFAWARGSAYVTARKKLFGLGLPLLGGVKLHAGGGINFHKAAPYISVDMMEDLLGDALFESFDSSTMEDKIIEYFKDNSETQTGFHVQAGIQLKLMVLDVFLNYRYTLLDLYPNEDGFGSMNLMVGFGF